MVVFLGGNQQRTRREVDQIGAMTFVFLRSTENLVKTRTTQKFWPALKEILLTIERRSSCSTVYNPEKIQSFDLKVAILGPHLTICERVML